MDTIFAAINAAANPTPEPSSLDADATLTISIAKMRDIASAVTALRAMGDATVDTFLAPIFATS